jgi:hypothetical protein
MLIFFYRKLASNLVMLNARHLLFYGLYNTENVMNEITHLPDSQKNMSRKSNYLAISRITLKQV